jgi:outer membrane biosynthesis protein TonB
LVAEGSLLPKPERSPFLNTIGSPFLLWSDGLVLPKVRAVGQTESIRVSLLHFSCSLFLPYTERRSLMLLRSPWPARASAQALSIAVLLSTATPARVAAQAAQAEVPTPTHAAALPTLAAPPAPPAPPTPPVPHPPAPAAPAPPLPLPPAPPAVPPAPSAPPIPPHPADREIAAQTNNERGRADAIAGIDHPRTAKSQRDSRERQVLGHPQQGRGRRQWAENERLRAASEAARREAERMMINARSPMDWRNRYSGE